MRKTKAAKLSKVVIRFTFALIKDYFSIFTLLILQN